MPRTTAVNFGSLVGAQLTALIEAEVEGAEKTSEYIENVGFEPGEDGRLKLRMVTFEMIRRDVDGVSRPHTISVPVLTLVPIPLLTIEEATLDFDLYVEQVKVVDTTERSDGDGGTGGDRSLRQKLSLKHRLLKPSKPVRLLTRLARTTNEDSKTTFDVKMRVKIAQSDFPLGIERLINTADLSVEDRSDAE
jgi:hypothetical protein